MPKQKFEKLITRIAFIEMINDNYSDPFNYINNREHFNELEIPVDDEINVQFLEIGQTITIEEQKYKIININFKLQEFMNFKGIEYDNDFEDNKYELSEFNSTVNLFIKKI